MKIARSIKEARQANWQGCSLVPTMGALHSGHLRLASQAMNLSRPAVVSIFVNPTQFGPNEDFAKYPRDLDRDLHSLEQIGVDWVFTPTVGEMYPGVSTVVTVPEVTRYYEGALRPGHFDGVATIVCKLFQICKPSTALFGLKDLQQCAVIRRMVADLNLDVNLHFEETVREEDGLAKSSRNVYLSEDERSRAPQIYRELTAAATSIESGASVEDVLARSQSRLEQSGFVIDYFDLIDLEKFAPSLVLSKSNALIAAMRLGSTRLIDNVLLSPTINML